jgi:hypothetical protein
MARTHVDNKCKGISTLSEHGIKRKTLNRGTMIKMGTTGLGRRQMERRPQKETEQQQLQEESE